METESYDNKLLSHIFFTKEDGDSGNYKCNLCLERRKSMKGYTNLLSHLQAKHSKKSISVERPFETIYAEYVSALKETGIEPDLHFTKKQLVASKWMGAVVNNNFPLSFVQNEDVRKLAPPTETICIATLKKSMSVAMTEMRENIKKELPNVFAVALDEWSHHSAKYIAIFAFYTLNGATREVLLAFAHLDEIPSFGTERIKKQIKEVLSIYGKNMDNVCCLIGDNCNLNKCIAANIRVPLLGCASHKLALAVTDWIQSQNGLKEVISVLRRLMAELRFGKNAIRLANLTNYRPVWMNETRWSSCFEMLQRYVQLEPRVKTIAEVDQYLLSQDQRQVIKESLRRMSCFQAWTKMLQGSDHSWYDVQKYLDAFVVEEPSFCNRLSREARIVQNSPFENALFKVCEKNEHLLSENEKRILVKFERNDTSSPSEEEEENEEEEEREIERNEPPKKKRKKKTLEPLPLELEKNAEYVEEMLKRISKNCSPEPLPTSRYVDLNFIPAASNCAERLFSDTKFIMSDLRTRTCHDRFEELVLLKKNRAFWKVKIDAAQEPKNNNLLLNFLQKES